MGRLNISSQLRGTGGLHPKSFPVSILDPRQWGAGFAQCKSLKLAGSPDPADRPCRELDLLERRLMESHATVIIPFDDRIIFVSSLNCTEFSGRLSEVS